MSEKDLLRGLAQHYRELCDSGQQRARAEKWRNLHNLKSHNVPFLLETSLMSDYVTEDELHCEGFLRNVERELIHRIRHVEEVDDDYVLPTYFDVGIPIIEQDFGIGLKYTARDSFALVSNHPVKETSDLKKLRKRMFRADRDTAELNTVRLNDIFGDLLPVRQRGCTIFVPAISRLLYDFIGENLYYWLYDEPEAVTDLLSYLENDRMRYYSFLETEGLIASNCGAEICGSGSYGFVDDLHPGDKLSMKEVWGWSESQETTMVSPELFEKFFLPPISRLANRFGLTYYGCCEQLHDRFEMVAKAIGNMRSVSVSPWSDYEKMADFLSDRYVLSKKLTPQFLSGKFDESCCIKETERVLLRRKENYIEMILRDIYSTNGDRKKFANWAKMMRSLIG